VAAGFPEADNSCRGKTRRPLQMGDYVTDGPDARPLVVEDHQTEPVPDGHDDVDHRQRADPEVVAEPGRRGAVGLVDAGDGGEDLRYRLRNR